MTEQGSTPGNTADPQTGLDRIFAALRGIGIRRRTDDKWIGGVCSGLADRLGVDPVIVRAALVLLSILGGVGVGIYFIAWALLPNDRNEIAAERALRDGDGGSIVLLVVAAFALFGGSWWGGGSDWGFPWGMAVAALAIWWVVRHTRNNPAADQRVSGQRPGSPYAAGQPPMPTPYVQAPTAYTQTYPPASPSLPSYGQAPTDLLGSPSGSSLPPSGPGQPPTVNQPVVYRKPRRRSGGPLMALVAIGLALVTNGSVNWLGDEYSWAGSHEAIAMAGSLAAIGVLLVAIGVAGWRAGFTGFLATVLAFLAFSISLIPNGIHFDGRVGDATWKPATVTSDLTYHLGAGDGLLDLRGLPSEGLAEARIPAYVGLGELTVLVPDDLTVKVVGHVGLGNIQQSGRDSSDDQGGSDISRTIVVGDGPTEVVVDAGVGVGQLTVEKE